MSSIMLPPTVKLTPYFCSQARVFFSQTKSPEIDTAPPRQKGLTQAHIDYFEIIGNYCAGLPLTCTLKTNLGVVFREVRTLNQVVL